jgi:single-strand DNA-binding protein
VIDFNRVFLGGRLTKDPEHKTLPNGTEVASFGLATNRKWKSAQGEPREEVLFVDVEFFGKTAAAIAENFKKGRPIFIEGRLKLDEWEAQDGSRKTKLKVIGDNWTFVDAKPGVGGGEGGEQRAPAPRAQAPSRAPAPAPQQQGGMAEGMGLDEEDLPF